MTSQGYWERIQTRRVARRRFIAAAGIGATGLTLAAACGGSGGPKPSTPRTPGATGEPQYGGVMRTARNAVFDTIDPYLSVASLAVFPRVYNVLLKQSALAPDRIIYDLAESYEHPDDTSWIFNIRPGVRIPPNQLGVAERDLDAEDVVIAYDRIKSLPEATACTFICNWIASHEAQGSTTYVLRTPKPYAWFLLQIGGTNFFQTIPPRELNQNPDLLLTGGVGGGPFFIRPDGYSESEFLIMDKNPVYYGRDPRNGNALPYVDGLRYTVVPDPAAVRVAFESKQSYVYAARNKAEVDELLGRVDAYEGNRSPFFNYISFAMNVERGPWADDRVRKAAMYALNRQEYVDIIYGGDADTNGLLAWSLGAYVLPKDERDRLQPYDPQRSRQLLEVAGHELPLKIDVVFPTGDFIQMDQHLAIWLRQMEEAGFRVEQHPMDLGSWIGQFIAKDYDASLHPNLEYETPEFPLDFQTSKGPAGSGIYSNGLKDPQVDAAIEATKEITEQEQLVAAIHDVQRTLYEKGPVYLPICTAFTRTVIWNFVKDYPTGGGTADQLNNAWWLEGAPG